MCKVTQARQALRIAPKGQRIAKRKAYVRAVAERLADELDAAGVPAPRWVR
jgi:hypothetical protein